MTTNPDSPVENVLSRLCNVKTTGPGQWQASCPVPGHGKGEGDRRPSLGISEGDDGRVLLTCHAGCDTSAVVQALGLQMADLYVSEAHSRRRTSGNGFEPSNTPQHTGGVATGQVRESDRTAAATDPNAARFVPNLTVEEFAVAKHLPVGFLRAMGCSDIKYQGGHAVRIGYRNTDGTEGPVRYRVALEKPDHGGECFRWKGGSKPQLLGLDRLEDAREAGHVILVEGETDTFTLLYNGIPALGVPGANLFREDRDAPHLDGIDSVYAVIEPDGGGATFRQRLGASSLRDRMQFIDLSGFGVKDVNALWCDDPDRFRERIDKAVAGATPWIEADAADRDAAAEIAWEAARELLTAPDFLSRVESAFRAMGYAGDLHPVMMAYVGITSRLLPRPLNMAFIAPSGAGKNHAVDTARRLHPEDAVIEYKATSERAMIYDDATFTHKVVLFSEADSIPEDGPAASAVRNLATDQVMRYDVVERDADGRFYVRHIAKPGPTSLMTTSTQSLAHQFDTRLLEVTIPDSEEQTRAVMAAHAAAVMERATDPVDTMPFLAMQEWLDLAGHHDVVVPFAQELAALVPARAVRMRRDFRQLITVVQTIALLHQCQREHAADGRIIATLDDYAAARELLMPSFGIVTSEGLTPAVRELVEAIGLEEEVSQQALAERLGLVKSTISYRVGRALAGGWLINRETRRNHTHRLSRGAPLPDAEQALPTVETLRETYEGSIRVRSLCDVHNDVPSADSTPRSPIEFERSNRIREIGTQSIRGDESLEPTGTEGATWEDF